MGCGASTAPPIVERAHVLSKKMEHKAEQFVMNALEGKSEKPAKKDKKSRLVNEDFFIGEFANITDECKKHIIDSELKKKKCKRHLPELKNCLIIFTGKNIYTDGIRIMQENQDMQPIEKIAASLGASISLETLPEILLKIKMHVLSDDKPWTSAQLDEAEKSLISSENPETPEVHKVLLQGFTEAYLLTNQILKLIPLEKKSCVIPVLTAFKEASFERNASLQKILCAHDKYWVFYSIFPEPSQLSDFLKVSFMENELAQIAKQVLECLKLLHAKKYVHRDLRPENVMLSNSGELMLCNINLGEEMLSTKEFYYLPPEVVLNARSTTKSDVWHLGCLLQELMEGNFPRHKYPPLKAMMRTAVSGSPKLKNPTLWTATILEFLRKCFVLDPEKRPGPEDLLTDDFIVKALPQEEFAKKIHGWKATVAEGSKILK